MKRLIPALLALSVLGAGPAHADDADDFRVFVQLIAAAPTNKNVVSYTKYDGRIEVEYAIGENHYHVRMSTPPYSTLSRLGMNRRSKRKLDIKIRNADLPSRVEFLVDIRRDGQIDRGFVIESHGKIVWPLPYAASRYREEIRLSVMYLSK